MISDMVKTLASGMAKNSPTILTGVAVAGVLTSLVLAVKATPEAIDRVAVSREERDLNIESRGERVLADWKAGWKPYVPTAVMGSLTIACVIGANQIHLRRTAVLASVYSLAEVTLKEYQEKVLEEVGRAKEEKIQGNIAQDHLNKHPVLDPISTGRGDVLCYDDLSGRYFLSSIEALRTAMNNTNHSLLHDGFISLNDFYADMGLAGISLGRNLGWTTDRLVDLSFISKLNPNGQPCVVVQHKIHPTIL